ncbi:CCA tRNA nucleotidyltransferase [Rhodobacteraceae bacterium KMM 6894]|nr:CCA tRNA nucleotidyltransferase [Rhodobacteraceae bacterium KMM 6894]
MRRVFSAFEAAGQPVYLVGGAVRDAVRGMPVGDLDLATPARPDQVMALAKAAGIRSVPTGLEHGTVTLVVDGVPHEITSFRRDVETFGRHATVAFTTDMMQDARRRDFTMNALYANFDGTVIDPLAGLPDALAGRVRFIEDANQRIVEDYLRSLRFFRFHAWYGGENGLDAEGLAAVGAHLDGLETLARERVGSEILRLLAAPDPAPAVSAMAQVGALLRVLPGADPRALAPLVHLEGLTDTPADPIRRLAALGGEDVQTRLRLSNADANRLQMLRVSIGSAESPGALGYRYGAGDARSILLLRAALLEHPLSEGAFVQLDIGARAVFPVKAQDLMPEYAGPALGSQLKQLEARWIASDFALSRAALLGDEC